MNRFPMLGSKQFLFHVTNLNFHQRTQRQKKKPSFSIYEISQILNAEKVHAITYVYTYYNNN